MHTFFALYTHTLLSNKRSSFFKRMNNFFRSSIFCTRSAVFREKLKSSFGSRKNFSTSFRGNNSAETNKQYDTVDSLLSFAFLCTGRLIGGFGIVYISTEYGVDLVRCEGPSMLPTINSFGDIILIEKFTHRIYGIDGGHIGNKRIENARQRQKDWESMQMKKWPNHSNDIASICWHKPKQPQATLQNYKKLSSFSYCVEKLRSGIAVGDVVVLQHPDREGTVCKRVIGLPGDTVVRPSGDKGHGFGITERQIMDLFEETDDKIPFSGVTSLSNTSLTVVPDGHIWVEGDNSLNSADSRNYGPVPSSLVIGKVWMRVWPPRGNSLIVRGARPLPIDKNVPFTGSFVIPAGNEGEIQLTRETESSY